MSFASFAVTYVHISEATERNVTIYLQGRTQGGCGGFKTTLYQIVLMIFMHCLPNCTPIQRDLLQVTITLWHDLINQNRNARSAIKDQ